ncbi:hypothetical protein JCM10599A_41460 [Paraburkholderia kururiensis]
MRTLLRGGEKGTVVSRVVRVDPVVHVLVVRVHREEADHVMRRRGFNGWPGRRRRATGKREREPEGESGGGQARHRTSGHAAGQRGTHEIKRHDAQHDENGKGTAGQ